MTPVMYMQRDVSDLRISSNLNDLPMIRGDNPGSSKSECGGSLKTNEIILERSFNIDNAQLLNLRPNKRVKSCRLAVINLCALRSFV